LYRFIEEKRRNSYEIESWWKKAIVCTKVVRENIEVSMAIWKMGLED
jgi:hypothetical protein